MGKSTIRRAIKALNCDITVEHRVAAADSIFSTIESSFEFCNARCVAIYSALNDEIPTDGAIKRWRKMGKQILLPKIVGDNKMEFYDIDSSPLVEGYCGILEPQGGVATEPSQIDLMIIPGVAFCDDGRRLGRGKGFYDRYLERCPNTYKIGICFAHQLLDSIPCDPHDMVVDRVIVFMSSNL